MLLERKERKGTAFPIVQEFLHFWLACPSWLTAMGPLRAEELLAYCAAYHGMHILNTAADAILTQSDVGPSAMYIKQCSPLGLFAGMLTAEARARTAAE